MVADVTPIDKGRRLRVALVSDLHVYDGSAPGKRRDGDNDGSPPSRVSTTTPRNDPVENPLTGLAELVKTEPSCDLLLSCGDMCDRASPGGLIHAWDELNRIAGLARSRLVATAGNHDHDSYRLYNSYDARAVLKSLTPPFPAGTAESSNEYWARAFTIVRGQGWIVVVVNSAAYEDAEPEKLRGRVAKETVRETQVRMEPPTSIRLLVCHHHPYRFGTIDLDDYSEMVEGFAPARNPGLGQFGYWTVVHGHKHYPNLCYAAGGATAPSRVLRGQSLRDSWTRAGDDR